MNKQLKKKNKKRKQGAVLLIAVLVASVALAVGIGVYNRTYKELLFASFWKQTQVAFAAADAGLECAIYWDLHPALNYTCFGNATIAWPTVFPATLSITTPLCVTIEITKNAVAPLITIKARGYNTCDTANPRRVERGLRIDY